VPPRALDPSGLFLIDKPEGPSSFAVVADVRRRTGARTGHAGTLDPFATGLLLVLSGSATKLASRFVGLDKRYLTDIDLTAVTDTGDREGSVTGEAEPPSEDELEQRLAAVRGEIELPVPTASAVKVVASAPTSCTARRCGRNARAPLARGLTSSPIATVSRALICASAQARPRDRDGARSHCTTLRHRGWPFWSEADRAPAECRGRAARRTSPGGSAARAVAARGRARHLDGVH
jgi:tRNA pseudouridine(55) synthase